MIKNIFGEFECSLHFAFLFDMPRSKRVLTNLYPYHVYNRCNNKEEFPVDLNTMWMIFAKLSRDVREKFKADLHQFVLMKNHYHLCISTPECNLDKVMWYYQSQATKWINRESGRINHIFGSRYRATMITSQYHYLVNEKYIYRNPIEANLTRDVQSYSFSTIKECNKTAFGCSYHDWSIYTMGLGEAIELQYLNTKTESWDPALIRCGLVNGSFRMINSSRHMINAEEMSHFEKIKKKI